MTLKAKYKKLLCRWFGHKQYEEIYAVTCDNFFGTNFPRSRYYYVVVKRTVCERCGLITQEFLSRPMRRSDLLKEGWFFENI